VWPHGIFAPGTAQALYPELDLVRLNLITDIADDKRLAACRSAFFTMKAAGDAYISTIRAQLLASIRAFLPVATTLLTAIGTLKAEGELHRVGHKVSLRPILSST
jgi:hypothetical protein